MKSRRESLMGRRRSVWLLLSKDKFFKVRERVSVDSISYKMLEIMRTTGHKGQQMGMARVDMCYNIIFTGRLL